MAHKCDNVKSDVINCQLRGVLRLLQVNCRSVYNKIKDLNTLIESCKADIVIGTESWLNDEIASTEIFSEEFEVYRRDRASKGGGVFICVTKRFSSSLIKKDNEFEIICVEVEDKVSRRKIQIIGAYRPPGEDLALVERLQEMTCREKDIGKSVIIAGDLNLPQVNWSGKEWTGGRVQHQINALVREGDFTQVVNNPTRINSILDVFLLKTPELLKACEILPGISDHDAVYLELY